MLHGLEKTLENCSLNKLALSFGLETVLLLTFKSEMPVFSVRLLLIYDQNFLLLLSHVIRSST